MPTSGVKPSTLHAWASSAFIIGLLAGSMLSKFCNCRAPEARAHLLLHSVLLDLHAQSFVQGPNDGWQLRQQVLPSRGCQLAKQQVAWQLHIILVLQRSHSWVSRGIDSRSEHKLQAA